LGFAGAHLAAAAGVFVAAFLVVGLGDDLGDLEAGAVGGYGDEGEVGTGDVAEALLADVFDHDADTDFHGGVEGAVYAGFEDEEFADADGGEEVEVIHGGGDGDGAGVAAGGHGADEIDILHEASAEEVAEGVGVGGEDDLGALGLGFGYGAGLGLGVRRFRHGVGHESFRFFCVYPPPPPFWFKICCLKGLGITGQGWV
jgi:hypothetical protein